jgi:tRNA(Ile2) C34 agmatinyltransferase TiaS
MSDRLARGSLTNIPVPLDKAPKVSTSGPKTECDLASACPQCSTMMEPEHAHYRCKKCGYRDSCCF